ncbi:DUF937 domain-containing protein [Comamonas aquatica]|uniref:DUF937 domain-containing protein n=1 Tax=Comamonas aquatica TaxID=225991 RepID=A0AA43AWC2_9BURK|nr:DUF937 domain-containing protein [Comamonas aquatica]MDH0493026.1 DUF937 domain-containing protein [Comamonas aquatica]MDH1427821.1 DUF937 domain-containing protein [Comamonas aquatica]MDH1605808.1 DUF937 domain-containing protein [Comamonas aquatica]MDH1616504.1 DUF937 domain-containing protein [Comamonas aquatica]MDH1676161.1 DUF937 domain-containing protein [Comamonas aquatica]
MHPQQSLVSELMAQLQGAPMQQMAQQLGADRQQIQTAVGAALPLLLGALGRNAAQPQGAADLMGALQRDHAAAMPQGLGGLGDLLGAVLGGAGGAAGAAILGHILGGSQQQAQDSLGQATGLGGQTAGQLLSMLAPIVMAFLAQRVQAGHMDAGSLGQSLEQERTQAQNAGGLGGGLLGSLLDQDGDGKLGASDLFKLGSAFLNNRR